MSVKRMSTLVALAVAAALTLAACGDAATDGAGSTTSASESTRTSEPSASSENRHDDADVAFAQGMIPHHAQAIEMSDMLLAKDGVDEQVRTLAEQIKAAQAPEIDEMTSWLEEWDADVPGTGDTGGMDHSGMGHGGEGMMTQQDMQALSAADGATASRLFLEQMVAHHRGAIQMAETELAQGAYPQAKDLAHTIVGTQQTEITEMERLLEEM